MKLQLAAFALVFFSAAVTQNVLLTRFLGLCPFVGLSKSLRASFGMGIALTAVTAITAPINLLIHRHLLSQETSLFHADLAFLSLAAFMLVGAATVQVVEWVVERRFKALAGLFGAYLPLLTVNCAVLGASLFLIESEKAMTLAQSIVYGLGCGIGWLLVSTVMAGLEGRIAPNDVPGPLRGLGATLAVAGILALAFMGFSGISFT